MILKENLENVRFFLNIPNGSGISPNLPSEPVIFDHPLIHNAKSEYERTNYIVGVYNDILQQVQDDVVFILEEDVWAEQGFLSKLTEPVITNAASAMSGVYNFRDSDFDNICLYDLAENGMPVNYREDIKPDHVVKCFVGSTGLMAIKLSVLKQVNYLRCKKIVMEGFENTPFCDGWDLCLGHDFHDRGISFYADPTLRTLHGRSR